jgi:hypothetical protein
MALSYSVSEPTLGFVTETAAHGMRLLDEGKFMSTDEVIQLLSSSPTGIQQQCFMRSIRVYNLFVIPNVFPVLWMIYVR